MLDCYLWPHHLLFSKALRIKHVLARDTEIGGVEGDQMSVVCGVWCGWVWWVWSGLGVVRRISVKG